MTAAHVAVAAVTIAALLAVSAITAARRPADRPSYVPDPPASGPRSLP